VGELTQQDNGFFASIAEIVDFVIARVSNFSLPRNRTTATVAALSDKVKLDAIKAPCSNPYGPDRNRDVAIAVYNATSEKNSYAADICSLPNVKGNKPEGIP
jgi:hypothetical protein